MMTQLNVLTRIILFFCFTFCFPLLGRLLAFSSTHSFKKKTFWNEMDIKETSRLLPYLICPEVTTTTSDGPLAIIYLEKKSKQ